MGCAVARRAVTLVMQRRDTSKQDRAVLNQTGDAAPASSTRGASTDGANITYRTVAGLVAGLTRPISKIDVFNTSSSTDRHPDFIT